ncbi:MAG: hypothetical protein WCO63_11325 [Bacteroidota bacterium]
MKVTYKRNGKKITQEFSLDCQNLFDQKNIFSREYNRKTGEKTFTYQIGRLIILQYRINF